MLPKLNPMYACCETSLFIPNTHRKKNKSMLFCLKNVLVLSRVVLCTGCTQEWAVFFVLNLIVKQSPQKKDWEFFEALPKLSPTLRGVSETNTGEQFCGSGQHRECQNKWVKSQGDLRLQIWHLEERYVRKLTPRKPHTPLIAVRIFFFLLDFLLMFMLFFSLQSTILSFRAVQNVTSNVFCNDYFHLVI